MLVAAARSERPISSYAAALEDGASDKLNAILPWIPTVPGSPVVDIGTGTGFLAAHQAMRHSERRVVAIDFDSTMLRLAERSHGHLRNVDFRLGDALDSHTSDASAVVLSSVLHEVYSYARGGRFPAVCAALNSAHRSLLSSGHVIIRDFICPDERHKSVLLRHHRDDIVRGHDFETFQREFGTPIYLGDIEIRKTSITYLTDLGSACEFILRKDFHEMWEAELNECYGFWSFAQAKTMLHKAGFDVVHAVRLHDDWVTSHRLHKKVALFDPDSGSPIVIPDCRMLLVGRKN